MKRVIKSIIVFSLLLSWLEGFSQNLSNRGKDFWVGYGHHQFMEAGGNNSQEMVLYMSAEQSANVTVTIEGTTWVRNYSIPANTVMPSEYIPKSGAIDARLISVGCTFTGGVPPCGGEGLFSNKAIHIVSDVPIVAYAHIFGSASSGASMLMPVETWGYSYISLNSRQNYAANCFSWVYAIAQHDNTVIAITPAVTTRAGMPAGGTFYVTLNRGQIYQTMAGPEGGNPKQEMTGTKIVSVANPLGECYPIAVFSGSSRTYNTPAACGSPSGGDNDNQQCFPSQAWGKRYLTAPTSNSNVPSSPMTNTFKIIVKDPTTIVQRNGVQIPLASLVNGTYYTFESNAPEYIVSDKPIMVAQFIHSGSACQGGAGVGDPEMMYISPIEQGIRRTGFYRNDEENIVVNYLTLIIPTNGVSSLRIDGNPPPYDYSYAHPRLAGYTVIVKRWSASKSQAIVSSDSAFTAITYGLGSVESYGYNAGTLINNLNAVSSIHNTLDPATPQHAFTCTNTPVQLSVLMAYQPTRLDWLLSQLGSVVSPNTDVIDNAPVSTGTVVINGITYYKYTLPGTYLFNAADTFDIPINGYNPTIENCYQREEFKVPVIVKGSPLADFTFTHTGCTLDTIRFSGNATTSNSFTIRDFNWTFPGPVTATGQLVNKVLPPGIHTIDLSVVSNEGCLGDTTKQITIYDKPPANFQITPASLCEGASFVITDTSSASIAVNQWYWDFGNGVTQNITTGPTVTYTYPLPGTYTIKHVARSSASCVSDTVSRQVTVYAKPTVSFTTSPTGCLNVTGDVQFTGNVVTPDGQTINTYAWIFNDPNSIPGNDNISALQNPVHSFNVGGVYNIQFSATTVNGCSNTTTVPVTFNLKPQLAFNVPNPVCENIPGTISIAGAFVVNGVPGTGIYHGPAVDAAGNFTPSIAGPGQHTYWYVFTSTGGCVDSMSMDILVHAKPRPNFTLPNNGCLPASGQVQFTNTSTIADAQTMTWSWNFNDPNANAGNPNTSTAQNPTHNFGEGTFNINLEATSSNGCTDDTTIQATFAVTPILNYPALTAVCENAVPFSVATATVINSITGTGVYSGPGTNAAGMFNPAVAGPGNHTITYTYTTSGGCVQSITSNILVHARPRPNFTFPGNGCLPASGQVQFNNTSTIADAQTMTWLWNFNDPNANAGNPNTSTTQNPTHNFLEGVYNINLLATSSNGCIRDTTITATFSLTPLLAYPALTAICENATPVSVATATVTNGATGTGVYSGPGTNAAGLFNPAIAGPGNHTITYTFTTAGGCVQSITSTKLVHAGPRPNFTFATGACLPVNGQVQFNNSSTIADAQTMTWQWNFNDPNANAGNPNTSTAQNPTHNFPEGTFNVNLIATSSNGCTKDTTIAAVFSVTPSLAYPALNPVCENVSPLSVATATVTNNINGTGVYSGPGTNAAGLFNPAAAGAGTHTITYTFTTTGGCIQSITRTILVHARPRPNFTFPNACLLATGFVQFNNSTTIADAQTMTWSWNFNDPNANAGNPNTSVLQNPTHNFGEGSFPVNLAVTSSNGCVKDTTITAVFRVTPALVYPALNPVCQNPGASPSSIASATVTNNVTGAGVYSGPGTNAAGLFDPNVAGPGIHTITYTFTTTGGCTQAITRTIEVYPRPAASFTATNSICLNQTATLTSTATIPSGTITTWNWSLGDGNTPSYTNGNPFTVSYASATNYTVQLVAISDRGCFSTAASQTVAVHPLPVANFNVPSGICMPGGSATFSNLSTVPDNSALTYQWNFGDGTGTSTAANPSYVYAGIGSYNVTVTATSAFGCINTSTPKVVNDFYDKPIASFTVTPDELCQGVNTVFVDQSSAPNSTIQSWSWNFGDGSPLVTIQTPTKQFTNPGNYDVTLTVTNTVGCVSVPFPKTVKVHLQPVIDAGRSFIVPQGTSIQFQAIANSPSLTFSWSPATGLDNGTLLKPTLTAMADQIYTLTATGDFGCTATDFITVQILKAVKVPNVFTPNGDGVHDKWMIPNLGDYPGCTVTVFNRYGQQVFYSEGYGTPWDGTLKGKDLPVGAYYYVIQLQNGFKPMTGSVTIIK